MATHYRRHLCALSGTIILPPTSPLQACGLVMLKQGTHEGSRPPASPLSYRRDPRPKASPHISPTPLSLHLSWLCFLIIPCLTDVPHLDLAFLALRTQLIFGCHNSKEVGAIGMSWVEAKNAAKHPIMPRTAPSLKCQLC